MSGLGVSGGRGGAGREQRDAHRAAKSSRGREPSQPAPGTTVCALSMHRGAAVGPLGDGGGQRAVAYRDRVQCDYFDAGVCRSCTLMGVDYDAQLADKVAHAERLLAPWTDAAEAQVQWLPPVASRPEAFRNKAKMVVGGTVDAPTLGILDAARRGVDLRGCG